MVSPSRRSRSGMEDEQCRDEWIFKTCMGLPACVCCHDGCRLVAGEQEARLLFLHCRIQCRQGPCVYSLYHKQYGFPEQAVTILFVMGFTSGGLTDCTSGWGLGRLAPVLVALHGLLHCLHPGLCLHALHHNTQSVTSVLGTLHV